MSRVRTILVLGYWVLGDIGRIGSYRYCPNIFVGRTPNTDIIWARVPPRQQASGTHYLEHQPPTSDAAEDNVRGDGWRVGVDSGSASQGGLHAWLTDDGRHWCEAKRPVCTAPRTKHSTVDRMMIRLTVLQAGPGCVLSPCCRLFDKQLMSVTTPLSNHSSTLLNTKGENCTCNDSTTP